SGADPRRLAGRRRVAQPEGAGDEEREPEQRHTEKPNASALPRGDDEGMDAPREDRPVLARQEEKRAPEERGAAPAHERRREEDRQRKERHLDVPAVRQVVHEPEPDRAEEEGAPDGDEREAPVLAPAPEAVERGDREEPEEREADEEAARPEPRRERREERH